MGNAASKPPAMVAEDLVEKSIRDNKVVVFSKKSCGYCVATKKVLSREASRLQAEGCAAPDAAVVELDDGSIAPEVAREVQLILGRMTGGSTVPRVFVDSSFIGGGRETMEYSQSGRLRFALMKAGMCAPKAEGVAEG